MEKNAVQSGTALAINKAGKINKAEHVVVSKRELAMMKREIKIATHYTSELIKSNCSIIKAKNEEKDEKCENRETEIETVSRYK